MNWSEENEEHNQPPGSSALEDDLFVFGYSCKVFRDDEKASWVEEGKHLIPWMGDSDSGLLVDRYDARGAIMDIRKYEPPLGGADYLDGLTPEELRIEKLCDLERYRDFDEDAEYDENIYQEAEFKRLQMAVNEMDKDRDVIIKESTKEYGSVGYTYSDNQMFMGPEPKKFQDELPYTQPQDLMIPPEILHPLTMKSHAIIEKTAKFIASHGTQMEIILKTKQAKNPQFDFLSHNDPLNPYYKFLVYAIKNNLYKPPDEIPYPDESSSSGSDKDNDSGNNSSGEDDGYLHPSLVKTSSDITQFIPKGSFKPSLNCSYSMLVSRIREVSSEQNARSAKEASAKSAESNQAAVTSPRTNNAIVGDVPPPQVHSMPHSQDQLIIEKMANYVVKNGPDFEMMARTKGDPRFAFLDEHHEHNWYYVSCKERSLMEAKAVVASKGFVSYTKVEPENTQSQQSSQQPQIPSGSTTSSTPIPQAFSRVVGQSTTATASTVTKPNEEFRKSNNIASAVSRVRLKDPPGVKGKVDKEKLIKICSSLPNFTSVLKQKSIEEDDENSSDKDLVGTNSQLGSSGMKYKDEEEIRKIKEERRKKAALFLQHIKKTHPIVIQTNNPEAPATIPEVVSDVESVPSPNSEMLKSSASSSTVTTTLAKVETSCLPQPSGDVASAQSVQNQIQPSRKSTDSPLSPITNSDVTMESMEVIKERVKSSRDSKKDTCKYRDREKDEDNRGRSSRSGRRSRSRHNHRRSRSSSLSDSNESSSSSSYSSRRKKSKRKHSKKSHKKRDRSRSKKSKKHRR